MTRIQDCPDVEQGSPQDEPPSRVVLIAAALLIAATLAAGYIVFVWQPDTIQEAGPSSSPASAARWHFQDRAA